jgi:hypothetical protein
MALPQPGLPWPGFCMTPVPPSASVSSFMHSSLLIQTCHAPILFANDDTDPSTRTFPNELTVGVQLAAPWAWMRHGQLEGVEIDDARAFARWLGRSVRFVVLTPGDVARALATSEVDLAIGGVQDDPTLTDVALSCRYSERMFAADEDRHNSLCGHVWAMPRHATTLFASLAFYLWSVRQSAPARRRMRLN